MSNSPRLLILGIDGATFDTVEPWAAAGYLPTLARLMSEGASGPLRAWPNMNSAAAWTSMITGYNPGQHGVYGFGSAVLRGKQHWTPTTGSSRQKETFWNRLSDDGDSVGVVNVPISYPADPVNGFMLAGMDTPSIRSRGFCHPPDLAEELGRQKIEYRLDVPNLGVLSQKDPDRGVRLAREMVDQRAAAIGYLMTSRPWDMLMGVFVVTDRLQHYYWPDEGAPLDGPEWAAIRDIYCRLDTLIGELIDRVEPPCNVLIVSDHGFGPTRLAPKCLNQLFEKLGLLRFTEGKGSLAGQLLGTGLDLGRRMIPQIWQRSLAAALPRLYTRAVNEKRVSNIDWSRTRAFATLHGRTVHLDLGGWQEEAPADPTEYDSLRDRVRSILLGLRNPESGRNMVKAVHDREDLYHGPRLRDAGDLIIEWNEDECGDSLLYEENGEEYLLQVDPRFRPEVRWKADHRPEGIFIAHGPSIRSGAKTPCAIYDVAPTALYLRGKRVPSAMDGSVIKEMFEADYLAAHPIDTVDEDPSDRSNDRNLSAEDRRLIEERLRGLGYIE